MTPGINERFSDEIETDSVGGAVDAERDDAGGGGSGGDVAGGLAGAGRDDELADGQSAPARERGAKSDQIGGGDGGEWFFAAHGLYVGDDEWRGDGHGQFCGDDFGAGDGDG